MKKVRLVFAIIVTVLLMLGWIGATLASVNGTALDWVTRVDGPQAGGIRALALLILVAAIGLAFVPEGKESA